MDEQSISRAELARRLGVQRSFVTRMLNGMPNLTLSTLVKIVTALNAYVNFQFTQKHAMHHGSMPSEDWTAVPVLPIHEETVNDYAIAA